jgi:glycosyltransferase involved in cell wall biosynthesis
LHHGGLDETGSLMRTVLHLIDTTGPGGAETVFTDLVRGIDRARYRSVVVTAGPGWVENTVREAGIEGHTIPQRGRFAVAYARKLRALLQSERVDLVHAHLVGASVYASLAAMGTSIPVVGTVHGHADLPASDRLALIRYGVLRLGASHIVAVSEALRQTFVSRSRYPAVRTSVIYNGIDPEIFFPGVDSSFRSNLGIGPDEFVFGALGNVRAPKAYDVLLRAAALLAMDNLPARVVIVGDTSGSIFPQLQRLHTSLGLADRVIFAGFRRDVPQVLRAFNALALSSRTEGFSLATVQALATGLPVIATRSGGPEEIIEDQKTGLLVPTNDPAALAAAMRRVRDDAGLRLRLSAAGPAAVWARFDRRSMLEAYQRLYDALLADRPGH